MQTYLFLGSATFFLQPVQTSSRVAGLTKQGQSQCGRKCPWRLQKFALTDIYLSSKNAINQFYLSISFEWTENLDRRCSIRYKMRNSLPKLPKLELSLPREHQYKQKWPHRCQKYPHSADPLWIVGMPLGSTAWNAPISQRHSGVTTRPGRWCRSAPSRRQGNHIGLEIVSYW